MIDKIIGHISQILQDEPGLAAVQDWQKINGLVPGKVSTISVGVDEQRFEEYTRDHDECGADFKIYVSLDNRTFAGASRKSAEHRVEFGDRALRQLVDCARMALTQDYTLRGAASVSHVDQIEFLTAEDHTDLHIAVITLSVKFYAERKKPYRSICLPVSVADFGAVTRLAITPVIDAEIAGLVKGADFTVVPEGIQWMNPGLPPDTYLIAWKFDAASAKVEHIHMIVNGEESDY